MTGAAGAGPLVIRNGGGDPFEGIEQRLAGTREVQSRFPRRWSITRSKSIVICVCSWGTGSVAWEISQKSAPI